MPDQTTDVKLRIDRAKDDCFEVVPAVKIGENRFRITASPGFAPGVASGDEIEMSPSHPEGYKILKRGMNVCVQVFFIECTLRDGEHITKLFEEIGGWLDGGRDGDAGHHLLIYTISVKVGFKTIENVMTRISKDFRVDKWEYGNIYGTDGVTPLNWWLQPE